MADWGRRTKYQAVTGVLLAWFAVGAAIYVAKPYLPAPKEQEELQDRGTFVREGAGPYIKWRPFDQQAIRLAKQTDKPILLVAGYAWSSISINWDSIFAVPDVAELVNKEFVPVRVDLLENPAWANAVLPLARAQRGDSRDYGIYVLTPEAKVLWAPSEQEIFSLNDRRLLGRLRHAHSLFGANIVRDEQAMQEGELSLIKGEIFNSPPDRAELLSRLTNSQSPYGGQSITIGIALRPPDWEFLMNHGGIEPVHEALRTMALSHRIDWLFGGVFDRLISTDPLTVEPIKTADANSGFLRVVARMSVHKPSDWIQLLLENQFDFVYEEFAQTDSPSFVGWEKEMRNRTAAHSFSPVQLARAVTSQDRLWAIENLGFDVQSNPQAMVSPKSAETIIGTQSRFEAILSQLREARSESEPSLRGDTSFSCRARAVSALLYSVRFLDDEARRARALAEFYELRDEMRIGVDDVAERAHPTIVVGTFPTYVAYASACMDAYQLTGDESVLRDAAAVVRRSNYLFFHDGYGPLLEVWAGATRNWSRNLTPELLDQAWPANAPAMAMIALKLHTTGQLSKEETDPWFVSVRNGLNLISAVDRSVGSLVMAADKAAQTTQLTFAGEPNWREWELALLNEPLRLITGGASGLYVREDATLKGPISISEAKLLMK